MKLDSLEDMVTELLKEYNKHNGSSAKYLYVSPGIILDKYILGLTVIEDIKCPRGYFYVTAQPL